MDVLGWYGRALFVVRLRTLKVRGDTDSHSQVRVKRLAKGSQICARLCQIEGINDDDGDTTVEQLLMLWDKHWFRLRGRRSPAM